MFLSDVMFQSATILFFNFPRSHHGSVVRCLSCWRHSGWASFRSCLNLQWLWGLSEKFAVGVSSASDLDDSSTLSDLGIDMSVSRVDRAALKVAWNRCVYQSKESADSPPGCTFQSSVTGGNIRQQLQRIVCAQIESKCNPEDETVSKTQSKWNLVFWQHAIQSPPCLSSTQCFQSQMEVGAVETSHVHC